ncbi:hypothetical protein COTS27_00251 [Spirochaetota bacterium]|nr:hypothetical protein COTS27_00251 [Spirochaetota bacterium]
MAKKNKIKKIAPKIKHPPQKYIVSKMIFLTVLMVFIGTLIFIGGSMLLENKRLKSPNSSYSPLQPQKQTSAPSSQNHSTKKQFETLIPTSPWYTDEQIALGALVYSKNCQVCHGIAGQGTPNWRTRLSNGTYPPPPLNGSAHTWHHSMQVLINTINKGGTVVGGIMPAFEDKLSNDEVLAVLAYIQSLWPREIYTTWATRINSQQ